MNFYHDKQVKYFCIFLLLYTLLIFLLGMGLSIAQAKAVRDLLLSHDRAVVTSLLEQDISKSVIAKAITNTSYSKEGVDLLANIGITEHTSIRFQPFISSFLRPIEYSTFFVEIFLSVLLFLGTFVFLLKRDRLYQQTTQIITRFIEGDFSCHIKQINEGTIYQLLSSIDQLATLLQSKNETERKAKEFLKDIISDIAHQLKTPLAAITLYHEIISEEPNNDNLVKKYSEKTGLALNRMEQLIQSMLKITRLDAGSIIFETRDCYISELISQAIYELTTRAINEGKEILIDGLPEEQVVCDLQWTSEAIGNIVKNALDHTEYGGKIQITWKHTPAMIRIFISDNGSGIASEDLHHIFKRFYRSKNSLDIQGVGLGLALAKSIVEGQGGIISVQSVLNKGTTFVLSFLTEL